MRTLTTITQLLESNINFNGVQICGIENTDAGSTTNQSVSRKWNKMVDRHKKLE